MASDEELRKAAVKRIKAKRSFWSTLGVFVVINLMMVAIWWLGGKGYFWPGWVMFGTGVAVLFSGLSAYGPGRGPVTEGEVDAEVRRMKGES